MHLTTISKDAQHVLVIIISQGWVGTLRFAPLESLTSVLASLLLERRESQIIECQSTGAWYRLRWAYRGSR